MDEREGDELVDDAQAVIDEGFEREQGELAREERERRHREEREERARADADRRAEKKRLRAQREAAEREAKERRARDRAETAQRERAELEAAQERRRRRAGKHQASRSRRGAAPPAKPSVAPKSKAPARRPAKPRPGVRPTGGQPRRQAPPRVRPIEHTSLRRPTAKAAVALAAVTAIAFGAGSLLGLPMPGLGGDEGAAPTQAAVVPVVSLDPGTPAGLSKGPYNPVVTDTPDYGEAAAKFGADRGGRKHEGQDLMAPAGTPLVAVRDGIVLDGRGGRSFYSYGGGNTFVMYSPMDDRSYIYLHMQKPALVRAGETVKAGQLIGKVGCTGSCDGDHLHFEVREGRAIFGPQRKPYDPLPLLRQWPIRPLDQGGNGGKGDK